MEPVDPRYYNGKELAQAAVPLEIRLNQPGHIVEKRGELLPRRHNLVTKRTVRCRQTFDGGSPGILLKPHINPLMGDSSMRTNVGHWFKKSSLAMSFYPRFTIESCDSKEMVVQVINPYDEPVHINLSTIDVPATNVSSNSRRYKMLNNSISNFPSKGFDVHGYDELAEQDEDWLDDAEGGEQIVDMKSDAENHIVRRELNRVWLRLQWKSDIWADSKETARQYNTIFHATLEKIEKKQVAISCLVQMNIDF